MPQIIHYGLDYRKFQDISDALVALWVKILRKRYCRSQDFLHGRANFGVSSGWSDILSSRELLRYNLAYVLGGRKNVWVGKTNWIQINCTHEHWKELMWLMRKCTSFSRRKLEYGIVIKFKQWLANKKAMLFVDLTIIDCWFIIQRWLAI